MDGTRVSRGPECPEPTAVRAVSQMPHHSEIRADVVQKLCASRTGLVGSMGIPHLYGGLRGVEARNCALIVVDLQENFFPSCPMNYEIVPIVNKMAQQLRNMGGMVVWITSDVGPDALDNWSVFYNHHFGEQGGAIRQQLAAGGADFGGSYDPMTASHGMDGPLYHELAVDVAVDLVIKKDRHSCFATGGRHQGRVAAEGPAPVGETAAPGLLEGRLRDAGIDTVLIAGCLTNCCCEASARDAMQRNFRTIMLADGCAAWTDLDHNAALTACCQIFGDVMTTEEVLTNLAPAVNRVNVPTSARL